MMHRASGRLASVLPLWTVIISGVLFSLAASPAAESSVRAPRVASSLVFPDETVPRITGDCPISRVKMSACCTLWFEIFTTRAVFDTTFGVTGASYDLRNGTSYLYGNHGVSEIEANDVFVVSGVPDGLPLTFTASLRSTGGISVDCNEDQFAACTVWFREGDSNIRSFGRSVGAGPDCAGSANFDVTLDLTIQKMAGEPFLILIHAIAGQDPHGGNGSLYSELTFLGLPPGATISSCQGYRQDVPIPAVPATWSSIKVRGPRP